MSDGKGSEYRADNPILNLNDSGDMQTTETVRSMQGDGSDLDGPGLDISAKILLQLGGINDKMGANLRTVCAKEQARLAAIPNRISFPKIDNTSTAWRVLNFGGPQLGRQWQLRSATCVDPISVFIFPPALCIGSPGEPAQVNLAGVQQLTVLAGAKDFLPQAATAGVATGSWTARQYSPGALMAKHGEIVYLIVSPGTSTDTVLATITVEDEPVAAMTDITVLE